MSPPQASAPADDALKVTTPRATIELDAYPLPVLIVGAGGLVRAANVASDRAFAGTVVGQGLEVLFPDEPNPGTVVQDLAATPGARAPMHARRMNGVPFTVNALASTTAAGELL